MKKRLLAAVLCLLLSLVLSLSGSVRIRNACAALAQTAEDLLASENDAALCRGTLRLCASWEEQSSAFSFFLHHKESDALQELFLSLRLLAEAEETQDVRLTLRQCLVTLRRIENGEQPRLTNIF